MSSENGNRNFWQGLQYYWRKASLWRMENILYMTAKFDSNCWVWICGVSTKHLSSSLWRLACCGIVVGCIFLLYFRNNATKASSKHHGVFMEYSIGIFLPEKANETFAWSIEFGALMMNWISLLISGHWAKEENRMIREFFEVKTCCRTEGISLVEWVTSSISPASSLIAKLEC